MTSAFTVSPALFHDDQMTGRRNATPPSASQRAIHASSAIDSNHLSPNQSSQPHGNSTSPSQNSANTPADSVSSLSYYQSSDFSEHDDDPFFGVDFSRDGGTPSFLDDTLAGFSQADVLGQPTAFPNFIDGVANAELYNAVDIATYPLTPDQTASLYTASPRSERKGTNTSMLSRQLDSVSPQELQRPFKPEAAPVPSSRPATQLTPQSGSCQSSEDGLAPAAMAYPCQSPRVTVSYWGKGGNAAVHERTFVPDADSQTTARESAGDLITPTDQQPIYPPPALRDERGNWRRDPSTGHRGLEPQNRPSTEIDSVNDMVTRREIEERNQEVGRWLNQNVHGLPPTEEKAIPTIETTDANANDNIPLGHETENKFIPGQTYFVPTGGEMTQQDLEIIHSNRNWADAPVIHPITRHATDRFQPETSQAAIARFERLCQDNESIVSRAATWGTRRRSLPSIRGVDLEGLSGNFLRKLTIGRSDSRKNSNSSLLKDLRTLVRKPSASHIKRTRSHHDEEGFSSPEAANERRESTPHLAPPTRTSSWGMKKPTPSINTALVSMGHSVAAIGTGHAHRGSISATPVTSPKSPFGGLTVKNTIRRPRSKSDLPRPSAKTHTSNDSTHSNLVDLWKKTGGPPVASLAKTTSNMDFDDDDDDEDDLDDSDVKGESSKLIDDITPTFSGFQSHVLRLNPGLANSNNYLVERIAHQQIIRYKSLLNSKVKHLQQGAACPCGTLCVALGGTAVALDPKGHPRGPDPLASRYDGSDDDITPAEGAITQDSFPTGIPMPPAQTLPAEFECQLCYQAKKFQKPSDWTKHVHEDVQPFTCTWDKCREPKIFKRKADWVRHENEGHRHLEWWTCDVEECRHTCYRRDNFLQHLVREHKFPEPKVKTKAALKRSGGNDPTWQKVERCHVETSKRPQEEPCRFCAKTFPSWKKLTVHLAKHMEQISLPVLRLVDAKDLTADSVISPVQDLPPRPFVPHPVKREGQAVYSQTGFNPNPGPAPLMNNPPSLTYQTPQGSYAYSMNHVIPQNAFQPQFFNSFDGLSQGLGTQADFASMSAAAGPGYGQPQQLQTLHQVQNLQHVPSMPVTSGTYVRDPTPYMNIPTNLESFPALNPLGLQATGSTGIGGTMGYDSLVDAGSRQDGFTPQGSASPYSHSPNQGSSLYYPQQ